MVFGSMVDRIPLRYVLAFSQMPLATAMIVAADNNVAFWAGRDVSSVVGDVMAILLWRSMPPGCLW